MKEVRPDQLASSGLALIAQVKKCGRAAQTVEETVEDRQPCFSKLQYFSYFELEAGSESAHSSSVESDYKTAQC